MPRYTGEHRYKGYGIHESRCMFEVYEHDEGSTVLVTDIDEGTSVTNSAMLLATQLVERFGLDPATLTFIECYRANRYPGAVESFDIVSFDWTGRVANRPRWSPSTEEQALKLLGRTA